MILVVLKNSGWRKSGYSLLKWIENNLGVDYPIKYTSKVPFGFIFDNIDDATLFLIANSDSIERIEFYEAR